MLFTSLIIWQDNNPFIKNKRDTSIYNMYDYHEIDEYYENLSSMLIILYYNQYVYLQLSYLSLIIKYIMFLINSV